MWFVFFLYASVIRSAYCSLCDNYGVVEANDKEAEVQSQHRLFSTLSLK